MATPTLFYPRHLALAFVALAFSLSAARGDSELPDLERFNEEIQSFVARDKETPPADGALLCIGSSSMRMWSDRMKADMEPLSVVPLGFGGSWFRDVTYNYDDLIGAYRPRAILLYEGDNDTAGGLSPVEVMRDFLILVAKIHEQDPSIRIHVVSIKPSTARDKVWPMAVMTNDMLKAVCEQDSRLHYVDVATALLGSYGEMIPELYLEDGIHLNDAGYDRWARAIREAVFPVEHPFEK